MSDKKPPYEGPEVKLPQSPIDRSGYRSEAEILKPLVDRAFQLGVTASPYGSVIHESDELSTALHQRRVEDLGIEIGHFEKTKQALQVELKQIESQVQRAQKSSDFSDEVFYAWVEQQRIERPEFAHITEASIETEEVIDYAPAMRNWHTTLFLVLAGEALLSYFLLKSALTNAGKHPPEAELILGAAVLTFLVATAKFAGSFISREKIARMAIWMIGIGSVTLVAALIASRVFVFKTDTGMVDDSIGSVIRSLGFLIAGLCVIPGGTILMDLDHKKKAEEHEKKRDFVTRFRNEFKKKKEANVLVDQLHNILIEKSTDLFSKGTEIEKKTQERKELVTHESEFIAYDSLRFKISALSNYLNGLSSYGALVTNTRKNHGEMRELAQADLDQYRILARRDTAQEREVSNRESVSNDLKSSSNNPRFARALDQNDSRMAFSQGNTSTDELTPAQLDSKQKELSKGNGESPRLETDLDKISGKNEGETLIETIH